MQETIDQFEMLSVMLAPDFDKSEWEFSWGTYISWAPLSDFESYKEHISNHSVPNETKFRKVKKTQVINGFVVPAPVKNWGELEDNYAYYFPSFDKKELVHCFKVYEYPDIMDNRLLSRGLIFKTEEDAAAVAKAMLGIDPYK